MSFSKAVSLLLILSATIVFTATFYVAYLYVVAKNPLTFNDKIFPVAEDSMSIPSGGTLEYLVRYCSIRDTMISIKRTVVGKNDEFELNDGDRGETVFRKGCQDRVVNVYIPPYIPCGEYYIRDEKRVRIIPFKGYEDMTFTTEVFKIEGPECSLP